MSLTQHSEPAVLWRDYCGTALYDPEDPAIGFDMRVGRCYELSGAAVVKGDLSDGILVHGTVRCENPISERMGHGWVLLNDGQQVWEPITGRCYPTASWYAFAEAEEERRYSREEAMIAILRHGHWGRWHESEWP